MNFRTGISLLMALVVAISAVLFGSITYSVQRKALYEGVDTKLLAVVHLSHEILGKDFHNRIKNKNSVTPKEYEEIVTRWNQLCEKLGLEYIWSLTKVNGEIVFTTGTSTSKKFSNGDHASFFQVHSNPEAYKKVFSTMKEAFQDNVDRWGKIRAVLVPFTDIHGRPYMIGASIKLSKLEKSVRNTLWTSIFISLIVLFIGLTLCFILAKSISKPITQLKEVAKKIANKEDVGVIAKPNSRIVEILSLAHNIELMRKSILNQIEEIKVNEENLRVTLNSIGDAVIATDINGQVVRMNPVAMELTGYTLEEARGLPLEEVFNIVNSQTRKTVESPVKKVLESGEIIGLANHTVLISRDKREYHVADSGAPIKSEKGEIIGVVLVFRNITEEYLLQEKLQHSQKMDAIGQLAGGVAHDFNNMLGGILGAAEMLELQVGADKEANKYLELIMNASTKAAELTKKLLAFARKQHVASTSIDVHTVINETVALLGRTIDRRITIQTNLDAEASFVIGDPSQLQSAFMNLGINSSHSMPEGGILSINSKIIELDHIYCDSSTFKITPGKYIEIDVRDTGKGISTENLPRVFEPFFSTKEQGKGTGLGLAAVYGTIQQHRGEVHVYSEVDKGTNVQIILPLSTFGEAVKTQPAKAIIEGSGNILVVDDEEVMRITARAILERLGYTVELAADGEEALELVGRENDKYDLIILDMIMPKMNGRDCFYELRKINNNLKIILSSGFSKEEDVEEMKGQGLAGYINKPYRGADLAELVNEVLSSKIK